MINYTFPTEEEMKAQRRAAVETYQNGAGYSSQWVNTGREAAFMETDAAGPHWHPPTVTIDPGVTLCVYRDGSIVVKRHD